MFSFRIKICFLDERFFHSNFHIFGKNSQEKPGLDKGKFSKSVHDFSYFELNRSLTLNLDDFLNNFVYLFDFNVLRNFIFRDVLLDNRDGLFILLRIIAIRVNTIVVRINYICSEYFFAIIN